MLPQPSSNSTVTNPGLNLDTVLEISAQEKSDQEASDQEASTAQATENTQTENTQTEAPIEKTEETIQSEESIQAEEVVKAQEPIQDNTQTEAELETVQASVDPLATDLKHTTPVWSFPVLSFLKKTLFTAGDSNKNGSHPVGLDENANSVDTQSSADTTSDNVVTEQSTDVNTNSHSQVDSDKPVSKLAGDFYTLVAKIKGLKDEKMVIQSSTSYSAAIDKLATDLENAANAYWSTSGTQTPNTFVVFEQSCQEAISKAEKVLATQHSFWNDVMIPLLNGILKIVNVVAKTLGIGSVGFFKPPVTLASEEFNNAKVANDLNTQLDAIRASVAPAV